ncbi:MAG TPA: HRDC domain-containing protein [Pyrinomonadaceae bacterium]|nr:HRDC domain-containing protein [Pyrinomonadaceae bacterium]
MEEPLSYRFIADAEEAAGEAERLLGEEVISLDTETYWEAPDSKSKVSLVQVASSRPEVVVFDALSCGVEPLRPLAESPAVSMVAHNARFDQAVLREAGLKPASFIDTLSLAHAALHLRSYSLAAVSEHLFGLPLDKTLRTSNWRRRPLTRAQIEYAALDARVTLRTYYELRRRLEAEGRWEAALRSALLPDEPGEAKPRRQRRPASPGPPLTPEQKKTVTALKKWRLERAFSQRVPAYMICPDRTLECLARERPETLDQLRNVYGLGESKVERFGEDLLTALRDADSKAAR